MSGDRDENESDASLVDGLLAIESDMEDGHDAGPSQETEMADVGESVVGSQDVTMSQRTDYSFVGSQDPSIHPARPASPGDVANDQYMDEDTDFSDYMKEYVRQTPDALKNKSAPMYSLMFEPKTDYDFLLRLSKRYEVTMDSASKAFRIVSDDDDNRYMKPYEGTPMYFMSLAQSQTIPSHIEDVLYWFYMLKTFIEQNGFTNFVVPTEKLSLQHSRGLRAATLKTVSSILEYK